MLDGAADGAHLTFGSRMAAVVYEGARAAGIEVCMLLAALFAAVMFRGFTTAPPPVARRHSICKRRLSAERTGATVVITKGGGVSRRSLAVSPELGAHDGARRTRPRRCVAEIVAGAAKQPPQKAKGASRRHFCLRSESDASEGASPARERNCVDEMIAVMATKCPKKLLGTYFELRSAGALAEALRTCACTQLAADFFGPLVQCAGRVCQPGTLMHLLEDMRANRIPNHLPVYESAMRLLAAKKQYPEALSVYSFIEREGLEPSPVTLSCLITFAAETGDFDRAVHFFDSLRKVGKPSIRACMAVLRVHNRRKDTVASFQVLSDMQECGVGVDTLALNVVLATCVSAGEVDAAAGLLQKAARQTPPIVDLVSHNTLLKGYAQQRRAVEAMDALRAMKGAGCSPNLITFNTVMDAAVRCGRVEIAWEVLDMLSQEGLQPDKCTCSTLVKGFQQGVNASQLRVALHIVCKVAKNCNERLRPALFAAVLEAVCRRGLVSLLPDAFEQMRHAGARLPVQECVSALLTMAYAGAADDSVAAWKQVVVLVSDEGLRECIDAFSGFATALVSGRQPAMAITAFHALEERARRVMPLVVVESREALAASLEKAGYSGEADAVRGNAKAFA